MSLTSYAQNFEDVMLWRALGHVAQGRYVDIGAQHPVIDSVSLAFYERGWRGVHVEPVPEYASLLRLHRPDETVIEAALSDADGFAELNLIPDTGLSTLLEAHARRHVAAGRAADLRRITVPTLTLSTALRPLAGQAVHWLKIDVEGAEAAVLKGWDSTVLRPWVMLVEATLPGVATSDHGGWEPLLLKANYRFAWFDGLNRYYVAAEHADLMAAFSSPPNVFDEIKLTAHAALCSDLVTAHHDRLQALTALATQAQADAARAQADAARAQAATAQAMLRATLAENQLQTILQSRSWRMTAPLRRLSARLLGRRAAVTARRAVSPDATRLAGLSPRAHRIYVRLSQASAPGQSHAHPDRPARRAD